MIIRSVLIKPKSNRMVAISLLILVVLTTRFLAWRRFMRYISKICDRYDKQCIFKANRIPELIAKLKDPDAYFLHHDWSAYHFLFLKGPHPYPILFSFRAYKIENFYSTSVIERLRSAGIL